MAIRAPGITSAFKAETRVRQTALVMPVCFLEERKALLEVPQQCFVYVSLAISMLLSFGYLELQGRLSMYLAFQTSALDAGEGERH